MAEAILHLNSHILIDQSHRQAWSADPLLAAKMNPANPKDAGYSTLAASATEAGFRVRINEKSTITPELLKDVDILVLPHSSLDDWENTVGYGEPVLLKSEIDSIQDFVAAGGGLLVLGETEQRKYGNNFNELISHFGLELSNLTVQDPTRNFREVASWPIAEIPKLVHSDFGYKTKKVCLYRAGTIAVSDSVEAEVFLRSSATALPAGAALGVAVRHKDGRVVVMADSDLFGDDSIHDLDNRQLWLNIAGWLSNSRVALLANSKRDPNWSATDLSWQRLVVAVEQLRPMQDAKGAILDASLHIKAQELLEDVLIAIEGLASRFSHQAQYLEACEADLKNWSASGFGVPDFYDSLALFRPDQARVDGIQHLAVFSMYTQNGNPNRNLEAVVINTFWPDWLAKQEIKYANPAFVPIEFVGFTNGYDTNSAVFFPETVSVREVATYHWGGIFCDREAARFRKVVSSAQELLHLPLPADAERLVSDQQLAQETFVLWDLIHDRTHSKGDLPFDPFMIKQRMPFWMYSLEELRCDLTTFRETLVLEADGDPLAKYMRYAILFDRLFRFPITGGRVRNYDGLGGQIIFAKLHKAGALTWTDNRLTFDWDLVVPVMVELCEEVEALYHGGINRSRLAQWIAAYEFVTQLVPAHPGSNWAKGKDQLPTAGELKEVVNLVLDDEFPLNVFYETLNRKLADVVASTKGIAA
jgi:hypothetical protein